MSHVQYFQFPSRVLQDGQPPQGSYRHQSNTLCPCLSQEKPGLNSTVHSGHPGHLDRSPPDTFSITLVQAAPLLGF